MKIPTTRIVIATVAVLLGGMLSPLAAGSASALPQPGIASIRLPLPSDAASPSSPDVRGISCGAVGFCVAVGDYSVTGGERGFIDTWSGGSWTTMTSPVPSVLLSSTSRALLGVSCFGSTTCAAYGTYYSGPAATTYLALELHNGTWTAREVGPPAGYAVPAAVTQIPGIAGVGCSGVDACALVGNAYNGSSQLRGWTTFYQASSGTWANPQEAKTPIDATPQSSQFAGVACGNGVCQAAGVYVSSVGPEPLVDTINSDGSTNSPTAHVNIPAGATIINTIDGIACDAGGACVAYGTYYGSGGDGTTLKALLLPVGGSGFQAQEPPTPTAESTSAHPQSTVGAAACAGGSCIAVGGYIDSGGTGRALLDRYVSVGWAAGTGPNSNALGGAACGASTFCVAFSTYPYDAPIDVFTSSGWEAGNLALPADADPTATPYTRENVAACDSSSSCWVLGTYGAHTSTTPDYQAYIAHVTPTPVATGPTVSTSSLPTFALGSSVKFSFHGTAGSSPIDHYVVQVRRSTWKSGFGSWSTPSGWSALSASTSSVKVALPVGDDTCVRVQAVDSAHVASAWSSARCTARPLDDTSLATSAHWTRVKATGFYLGTYTSTKTSGATMTLSGAEFDRLALVATKCPSCGKVAVYSGSTLLGTINLYKSTTAREQVIALTKVSYRTANIRLKVTTSGKTIQIDGLGVSRT
ncbi:MAG: hypothetical protein ACTHJM_00345 [Marmoricola sp.]